MARSILKQCCPRDSCSKVFVGSLLSSVPKLRIAPFAFRRPIATITVPPRRGINRCLQCRKALSILLLAVYPSNLFLLI